MLRAILISLSKSAMLKRFALKNRLAQKAARRFVAGLSLEEAVKPIQELNAKGILVTMDFLGESVSTGEEALEAANEAIRILETIQARVIQGNVSVKLTQLGLELGQEFCRNNVARIVEKAKAFGNFVRIDMEGTDATDRTLDIFYALLERFGSGHVGIVIQSYLCRTEKDVTEILKRGGRIRLCKGAYKEPAALAFPKKKDVNASFAKLTRMLLDSGIYHGIATHDETMIRAAKEYARGRGIDPKTFEFQMLYGIRRDLQEQLVKDGYNMRVYVPYGRQWYPYNMRRLAERPANLFFILKNVFRK
jgi:proline dehydrogenase